MEEVRGIVGSLVQQVTRMFYEPHHVVIMDIMLQHLVLDEEDLADKMKLLPREFSRMAVKLKDDRLLSFETISDLKEDGRQVTTTKFFLDFRLIRDIVKYKIYTMTQKLEKKMRASESAIDFGCLSCGTSYSVLDAQSYLSVDDYTFRCPECQAELHEKKERNVDEKESASTVFSLMMEEIAPIIQQLKEIDRLGIPEMLRGKIILSQASAEVPKLTSKFADEEEEEGEEEEGLEDLPDSLGSGKSKSPEILIGMEEKEVDKKEASEIEEMITVNGVPTKFKDVTESDKELMNEEEYEKYFELYEKWVG
ncbi:transcription initiation factor TFIIE subunit alpha [Nematocida homosporus]|uniref:transcription initiation factor TFIIE subunit alpha n=1 Tax=Nematocida homosporus TaxID=1912981 RepID=UPI00221FFCF6|nr:transcription initiation factor TFIIE subunit alpha [Nematocida homosporus]KAI5186444.1 transcription initiation factor TFIIE subunit alpha [Nematocida homosporus]